MVGLVGAGGVLSRLQEALTPFFAGSWAASGWVPRVLISAHARRESITNSVFIWKARPRRDAVVAFQLAVHNTLNICELADFHSQAPLRYKLP